MNKTSNKFIAASIIMSIIINLLFLLFITVLIYYFAKYSSNSINIENRCFSNMLNIREYLAKGILNSKTMSIDDKTLKINYVENTNTYKINNFRILNCPLDDNEKYRLFKFNNNLIIFCPIHGFYDYSFVKLNSSDQKKEYFSKLCQTLTLNPKNYEIEFYDTRTLEASYHSNNIFIGLLEIYAHISIIYISLMLIITCIFVLLKLNFSHYFYAAFITNLLMLAFSFNNIMTYILLFFYIIMVFIFRKLVFIS